MAPRRASPPFGFPAPNVGAAFDNAIGHLGRTTQAVVMTGRQTVDAARREATKIGHVVQSEMKAAGLVPVSPASTAPKRGIPRKAAPKPIARPATDIHRNGPLAETKAQFAAGLRGAADGATFGLGDKVAAAAYAVGNGGLGGDLVGRFQEGERREEARDQYDRDHYGRARTIGEIAGTVGSLALTGGVGYAPAGVRLTTAAIRGAPTAKALLRVAGPQAALLSGGAASSVAGQAVADGIASIDQKKVTISSPAAYASAALGGATGALATRYVGARAGAGAEAVTTHLTHSALSGEPVSVQEMQRDALIGQSIGGSVEFGVTKLTDSLPPTKKGNLGDWLGEKHSALRGDPIVQRQVYFPVSGGKTRADAVSRDFGDGPQIYEYKFGQIKKLSNRQAEAASKYGDRYHVLHYKPSDVGKIAGGPLGLFSTQLSTREDN